MFLYILFGSLTMCWHVSDSWVEPYITQNPSDAYQVVPVVWGIGEESYL